MTQGKPPLKIQDVASRFTQLLEEAGTSRENPAFEPTWRAFVAFCQETVDCDDERLFFEADISTAHPDAYYVHFARTFYGRATSAHLWSYEVICDFLFPLDDVLDQFNCSIEADELSTNSAEKERFWQRVQKRTALLNALKERQPLETQIYMGES